jgi:transposase
MEASSFIPHDWREWRRFRALDLNQQGWSQRALAEALGAFAETISRGRARARHGGREALLSHPAPGPPPTLSDAQKRLIPEFLGHGPEAYGFRGQVWTRARIARVLEDEFGVRSHHGHVGRWLREWGWTPQVPIRRAIQRDEEALRRGREETWPTLRQPAWRERRVLVFVDESGFSWLPGLVRTYAPEGLTPVLREKVTRDPLSVLGGMTPAGTIDTLVRPESLTGLHRVEFLPHLGRVAGERLWVIGDGSPIHRRAEVKEFVSSTRSGVGLESLPGYAPDLNPWDEGGWHHLKNVEMRNPVGLDLEEWHQQFHLAIGRRRQKPHWVRAFFAQAGLMIEKT